MPATMKGAISFGLLHVPISLHTATQDNDIRFHQLCREDGSRVKYKKVCASCGKPANKKSSPKMDLTADNFQTEKGRRRELQIDRRTSAGLIFYPAYWD